MTRAEVLARAAAFFDAEIERALSRYVVSMLEQHCDEGDIEAHVWWLRNHVWSPWRVEQMATLAREIDEFGDVDDFTIVEEVRAQVH